jgi:hypothetical protein
MIWCLIRSSWAFAQRKAVYHAYNIEKYDRVRVILGAKK